LDISNEMTNISAAAMQQCHKLIQVWNGGNLVRSIEKFIDTNVMLSCPMDKMRGVVINKVVGRVGIPLDEILKQYRFNELAKIPLSYDIAELLETRVDAYNAASKKPVIQQFVDAIGDIAAYILNLSDGTAEDIKLPEDSEKISEEDKEKFPELK
ncbi:MAG: hypothetical protein LBM93_01650, partial [Oscillospiraceae bacterium]|nr:hypothetical protein [Oscillospiraceae bacterium]